MGCVLNLICRYRILEAGTGTHAAIKTRSSQSSLAILHLMRKSPIPGELQEIANRELSEEEWRMSTQHLARMREEWRPGAEENTFDPTGDAA